MARMYADEILSMVRKASGNPDTGEMTDARLLRLINEELFWLCMKYEPPELKDTEAITTADGTNVYTYSATVMRFYEGKNSTLGGRLYQIGMDAYQDMTPGATLPEGPPNFFAVEKATDAGAYRLYLYPTPGAVYTITLNVLRKHPELVISPATSVNRLIINEVWDSILVDRSVISVLKQLEKYESALAYMKVSQGQYGNSLLEREMMANKHSREKNFTRGRLHGRFRDI